MKKIIICACFFMFSLCNAQETFIYKSGGRIFNSDNEKLSPSYLRERFSDNTDFLELYNSGRTKKTIGNILLYGGITSIVVKHYKVLTDNPIDSNGNIKYSSNTMYFVGAALIAISIPIKIGFSNKIDNAVDVLNISTRKSSVNSTSLIFDSNGIGLSMTF